MTTTPDPAPSPLLGEVLKPIEITTASDGAPSMRVKGSTEIIEELGLDPEMTVDELQRRLAIAERVIAWHEDDVPVPLGTKHEQHNRGAMNAGVDIAAHYFYGSGE